MRSSSHPSPLAGYGLGPSSGESCEGGETGEQARRDAGPDPQQGPLHVHHRAHLQTRAWASTAGRMETPALAPPPTDPHPKARRGPSSGPPLLCHQRSGTCGRGEAEPRVHCPPRLFTGLYEPVTSFGNNPLVLVFIADPGLGVEAAGLGAAVTGCKI